MISEIKVKRFIRSFYLVGAIGFIIPFTQPVFQILTPVTLLGMGFFLGYYHKGSCSFKKILLAIFIVVSSFFAEMAGVQTGKLFCAYTYGSTLGFSINGTPLLIGLNWLMVSYMAAVLVSGFVKHKRSQIVLASLIMVGYDFIV